MIGIIVTGHGGFASGMTSALKLIVGDLEAYEYVDFESLDGISDLEKNLLVAFDKLSGCDGILVFCDIVGGSPFKTAVTLSIQRSDIRVIAGTNLGALIETYMSHSSAANIDELVNLAIETAKSQVVQFRMSAPAEEVKDSGEGI